MAAPDFWDNPEVAQKIVTRLKRQNLPWTFVLLSVLSIWYIYNGHNIYYITLIMSLICMAIVNFIKEDYKKVAEKRAFQKELKRKGSFLWRLENDYPDPSIFYVLIFLMMFINLFLIAGWGITHATKEEVWNDLCFPVLIIINIVVIVIYLKIMKKKYQKIKV